MRPFLDAYRDLIVERSLDAKSVLCSADIGWAAQQLAYLVLSESETQAADGLIQCHATWCQVLGRLPLRDFVTADIATLVSTPWTRFVQFGLRMGKGEKYLASRIGPNRDGAPLNNSRSSVDG